MDAGAFLTEHRAALAEIRLVVLDVDGTLTDGAVRLTPGGEAQSFCVRDGQGLVWLRRAGIEVAWISGRGCDATRERSAGLGVSELHLGVGQKGAVLEEVQGRLGITPDETLAMGDDIPDLALAQGARLFVAPADGVTEVRAAADWVSTARAGHGAAREVCEVILKAREVWDEIVASSWA